MFTGFAPSTSTAQQFKELKEIEESVAPKFEVATQRLEEAKVNFLGALERVVTSLEKAVTTVGDLNPSLQKRLTASKFAFQDVVTSLVRSEEEFTERYDVLLDRYMSNNVSMPTKKEGAFPGVNTERFSPVSSYIRSAFVEVNSEIRKLKGRFDKLTQFVTSEEKDE